MRGSVEYFERLEELKIEQDLLADLEEQDVEASLLASDDYSMYPGWEAAYSLIDEASEYEETLTFNSVIDRLQLEEGQNGLFFRSKLPLELFIQVISYLDSSDVIRCSQTCCHWRKSIIGNESLWDELKIDLSQTKELIFERTTAISERSNGNLRSLVLGSKALAAPQLSAQILEKSTSETVISRILRIISYSGCRKLRSLNINISNDLQNKVPLPRSIEAVEAILNFCKFAAVGVQYFTLNCGLKGLPAGFPFIANLPNSKRFTLVATSTTAQGTWYTDAVAAQPRLLRDYVHPVALSGLVEIYLSDVHLHGFPSGFPHFPHLLSLKLLGSIIASLYDLLAKCCSTLRTLVLHNVHSSAISNFPSSASTTIQDVPRILTFPQLEMLDLSGDTTSLFKLPVPNSDKFTINLPVLKSISFAPHTWTHNSQRILSSFYSSIDIESLSYILRHSVSLQSIDLSRCQLSNDQLFSALKNVTTNLRSLVLTHPISDNFIDSLFLLVPSIQYLDVQDSEVTLAALARLAVQFQLAELPGQFPKIKLELHTKLKSTSISIHKLTQSLKVSIRRLSKNQLDHLLNYLVVSKCPGGRSFEKVKEEVLNFDLGNTRIVGILSFEDQGTFNHTREMMRIWQLAREERWAKDWFHSQDDIELHLH